LLNTTNGLSRLWHFSATTCGLTHGATSTTDSLPYATSPDSTPFCLRAAAGLIPNGSSTAGYVSRTST